MGSERFTEIGYQTIICDYLYEPVVLPRHFLQQLKQIIFWKCFTHHFIKLYTGEGVVGRLPWKWS
jgi:hypothetical protein